MKSQSLSSCATPWGVEFCCCQWLHDSRNFLLNLSQINSLFCWWLCISGLFTRQSCLFVVGRVIESLVGRAQSLFSHNTLRNSIAPGHCQLAYDTNSFLYLASHIDSSILLLVGSYVGGRKQRVSFVHHLHHLCGITFSLCQLVHDTNSFLYLASRIDSPICCWAGRMSATASKKSPSSITCTTFAELPSAFASWYMIQTAFYISHPVLIPPFFVSW